MGTLRRSAWIGTYLVFVLLTPFVVAGTWVRGELRDTEQYVKSVAPLATKPEIQAAVSTRIMALLDAAVREAERVPGLGTVVPEDYFGYRDQIEETVEDILASSDFAQLWEAANRIAHPSLVALVTGTGSNDALLAAEDGVIEVDLAKVFDLVVNQLAGAGIDVLDHLNLDTLQPTVTIFRSKDLAQAQSSVEALYRTHFLLSVVAVLAGLLYLLVSIRRWRALFWLGIGLALAMAALLLSLRAGRRFTAERISEKIPRDAAEVFYTTLLDSLRQWVVAVMLFGIAVAVVLLIADFVVRRQQPLAVSR